MNVASSTSIDSLPSQPRSGSGFREARFWAAHESSALSEDRFFDADRTIRRIARSLYEEIRDLPLICPHGHVDPSILATNAAFPGPTELILRPDHYVFRMLYSRGIPLEQLGIPEMTGGGGQTDPRKAWQIFGENYFLFRGTPTGAWLSYQLLRVFGIRKKLTGATAQVIYDEISEKLASPEFRPRSLFERFNIEVLTTTDSASDGLEHHQAIRQSGWHGRVVPAFRPDALFRIDSRGWVAEIDLLGRSTGRAIRDYTEFSRALAERRSFFRGFGATSTDHGVFEPFTARLSDDEVQQLFQKGLTGMADQADQRNFQAHMLMEMARMSIEDGMVMQIHPGSLRNHNQWLYEKYGPDKGADIPVAVEFTQNLSALLNAYGNDPRLTLVLFTLDESTYTRELAPLAGHYPALRLGPPWWFNDSIEGMKRFREKTTETAGIYNTVGFNDDTRAFCSIPARHDLARRIDANYLAGLVARHVVDLSEAREMARALAYDLPREAYKTDA